MQSNHNNDITRVTFALFSAQTPALAMMKVTANESWIQNKISHLNEEELSDFFGDGLAPDSDQNLTMDEFGLDFNVTSVLEG